MISSLFSYKGRLSRSGLFVVELVYAAHWILVASLPYILGEETFREPSVASSLFAYGTVTSVLGLWIISAQRCRRLHDFGRSGWWQLAQLALFFTLNGIAFALAESDNPSLEMLGVVGIWVNILVVGFALYFFPSERGENEYGPPPGKRVARSKPANTPPPIDISRSNGTKGTTLPATSPSWGEDLQPYLKTQGSSNEAYGIIAQNLNGETKVVPFGNGANSLPAENTVTLHTRQPGQKYFELQLVRGMFTSVKPTADAILARQLVDLGSEVPVGSTVKVTLRCDITGSVSWKVETERGVCRVVASAPGDGGAQPHALLVYPGIV